MSGETLFVSGNVHIPYGNTIIRADSAMIDTESNDIEAKGNVQLTSVKRTPQIVTIEELDRLLNNPRFAVEYLDVMVDPLGVRKIKINVVSRGGSITADRLSGNLLSGMMTFTNLQLQAGTFTCKAKRGVRQPGGELKLEDAEFSSCEYLRENQEHFSIALKTADLYPHERNGYGFANVEKEHSQYSVWGYNTLVRIYDVPILWLPLFYAPKDESPQLFQSQVGKSSDWGFYGLFSKRFDLMEYPRTSVVLDLDWYSLRGIGYGMHGKIVTENSFTDYLIYNIYDKRPYESSSDKPWRANSTARLNIPNERFDLRVTHMTHLTPRLDFRGQAEYMSDAFMLDDYFSSRAYSIDQPASYAALEYQADRYSAALYTRFRLNDFYTAVQKLPEGRLDVPRQEIFAGTNLYYQGSMSAAYMRMNWAEFDRPLKNRMGKLRDYEASRFDSVNFLYYPIRTRYINIVPRAGIRFTGYSNTSRNKVGQDDIYNMQAAATDSQDYGVTVRNYDDHGSGKVRVLAEFG
ncbi:MAG: LPS-assembly protein LptD, partial [Lentisphaeria bacterium]|nr:LPS-assembly protein LptD [Lentisphaeria bacterium]